MINDHHVAALPIAIRHIDFARELSEEPVIGRDEFIVLWHCDWPVGQFSGATPQTRQRVWATGCRRTSMPAPRLAWRWSGPAARQTAARSSVVICTRDRAEELSRCPRFPAGAEPRAGSGLVVDNASRDDGRTRVAALAAGADYVREDRPGLDIARNRGVRAATGDIVAFTDDDVRLHPRWLERLTAAFDADRILAVTGLALPAELETLRGFTSKLSGVLGAATGRSTSARTFFERTAPMAARPGRSAPEPAWPFDGRRSGA